MTQRITIGFVGADFATIALALASIAPGPFSEPIVLEVHADTPSESVVVPNTLTPTQANPLILFALRGPTVASPFASTQILTGSFSIVAPPQPRLQRPVMTGFDLQADNTTVDGFKVTGDVEVNADFGLVFNGNLVEEGRIVAARAVPTSITARISNNEIRLSGKQEGIRADKVSDLKLYHNAVLQRRADSADLSTPSFGINITESSVEAKNNIFAGQGANAFALRFIGDPSTSVFDSNFFVSFDGAIRFTFAANIGDAETETDDVNQWTAFAATSTNNFTEDPEFRDRTSVADVDLDVSNTSPTVAAAPAIAEIETDVRSERRPIDFVTIGAHEHAEIITEQGQKRFLELLGGLSTDPVTKTVLADSGEGTLIGEFKAEPPDDETVDELFTPIQTDEILITDVGTATFKPSFQITLPIYGEMIDAVADRADEIALLGADNLVFMVKRMRSIPFDSTGFLHTQVTIPITVAEQE